MGLNTGNGNSSLSLAAGKTTKAKNLEHINVFIFVFPSLEFIRAEQEYHTKVHKFDSTASEEGILDYLMRRVTNPLIFQKKNKTSS